MRRAALPPHRAALGWSSILIIAAASGAAWGMSGCRAGSGGEERTASGAIIRSVTSATVSSALTGAPPVPLDPVALWRRTLNAAHTLPVTATVSDTRFKADGGELSSVHFRVVEGVGESPRFRMTYSAPNDRAGVVVLSDGSASWQYDPRRKTIIELTASAMPSPSELEDGVAGSIMQSEAVLPEIEPRPEKVDGRTATVLALRRKRSKRIVERRWVDIATGRTLRLELYGKPDARLMRRVEMTDLTLPKASEIAADSPPFQPDFPPDAILIDRRGRRVTWQSEAESAARHEHLPLHVRGYTVRAVNHGADLGDALPISSGAPSGSGATHLLYSRGDQAISVFVTTTVALTGGKPVDLQPGPNWRAASLDSSQKGFTQESSQGAAVAWAEPHRGCYIVVAHMPLADLLPVAGAFASDRDDAPGVPAVPLAAAPITSASQPAKPAGAHP